MCSMVAKLTFSFKQVDQPSMANTYKVELPTSSDCSVIAPWPTNQTQITCLCLESKTLALSLLRALHLISCQARIRFTSWAAVLPKAAARALLRHWVFPQERLFTPLQQPLGCQPSSPPQQQLFL